MYLLYDTEVLKAHNKLVDSQKEHQIIIDALKNRDLNLAVKSISSHIEQSGLKIMHYLHKQDIKSSDDTSTS